MAKKPTITTVASGFQATTTINNNFQNLRDAFDNTLSLDGSTPNAMNADLDMNGNDIINVGSANGNAILTVSNGDARYVNTSGDTMTGSLNTPALYTNGLYINGNPVLPDTLSYNGIVKETKIATSGQTVFNLSSISYTPGINNLAVYVDGVYQRPANYTETNATRVTFSVGIHVGGIVDFVVLTINALSGTADATNLTYTSAGSGAVITTVSNKLKQTISVRDFGADPTGAADSTVAIQNAVVYAETIGADVIFPSGSYSLKQVFVTVGNISLIGQNATIIQSHDNVNSVVVGSPGEYKVSAAFFLKRDCNNVEITGFQFTTNDASFPARAVGFGSYFPSIGGQFADNVYIHHNVFLGGQDRCMFFQAGNGIRFENNTVFNNGFTIHIGYLKNVYFYDNSSDVSVKYSPTAVSIINNVFDGYNSSVSTVMAHLTGCTDFTVRDNKFQNITIGSIGSCRVIRLYANDFGPFSQTGSQLDAISGTCFGNMIEGTFTVGIEVDGSSILASSTWTNSFQMRILVEGNTVRGTGNGIKINEVQDTKIVGNYVDVTESPLFIENRLAYVTVDNNTFRSTAGGYNDTAIYTGYSAGSGYWTFTNNRVVVSTLSQYIFNSSVALTWFVCNENNFYFDGDVAGSRLFVLTLAGKSWFKDNIINVQTDVTNAFVCLFTGSGTTASLNFEGNQIASGGAGAATLRCINAVSFVDVNIHKNTFVGALLIEDCNRTFITNNTVLLPASNGITCIDCDNSGYAVKALVEVHSNYVLQPSALNVACVRIVSNNDATNNTLSKVTMNYLSGNSAGSLLQQTVYGELGVIGNTIVNAGTGGTTPTVTGSATLVNF